MATERLPVQAAISESGYYLWRDRPPSARAVRHAWLIEQIEAVHTVSKSTAPAGLRAELALGLGSQVGHGAVEMLMRRAGLSGRPVSSSGVSGPGGGVAEVEAAGGVEGVFAGADG